MLLTARRRLALTSAAALGLLATSCQGPHRQALPPPTTARPTTAPPTTIAPTTVPTTVPDTVGQGWSAPVEIDQSGDVIALSCPTATYCMAVDEVTSSYLTFDGHTWTRHPSMTQVPSNYADDVSCASPQFCVVVGVSALAMKGQDWTYTDQNTEYNAVSCSTPTFCAAVDNYGTVGVYDGTKWTRTVVDPDTSLSSISCVAGGFCAAVDQAGQVVMSNHGVWGRPLPVDLHNDLSSVSCASLDFCAAVDKSGRALMYNGSTWSAPADIDGAATLVSTSCTEPRWCVAIDADGQEVSFDGALWEPPAQIDNRIFVAVSCASDDFCMAIDSSGSAETYRNQPQIALTADMMPVHTARRCQIR